MPLDITELGEAEAGDLVRRLLSQLGAANEEVEAARRKAAAIRKMIEAVVEMFPDLEDDLPEDLDDDHPRPRGAEAVRRVLEQNRGTYYTTKAIVALLGQQGWMPQSSNPSNAVRTAAERLVERGVVEKDRAADGAVVYRVSGYDPAEEPF